MVVSAEVHVVPLGMGLGVWMFWRVVARWGWVGSRVPYIALLRVAYTLNNIYSAPRKSVRFDAQISGLRKQ